MFCKKIRTILLDRGRSSKMVRIFRYLPIIRRGQAELRSATQITAKTGREVGGYEAAWEPAELAASSGFTRSRSSLDGLKYGTFFAGTSTRSPVLGLRPMRGLR